MKSGKRACCCFRTPRIIPSCGNIPCWAISISISTTVLTIRGILLISISSLSLSKAFQGLRGLLQIFFPLGFFSLQKFSTFLSGYRENFKLHVNPFVPLWFGQVIQTKASLTLGESKSGRNEMAGANFPSRKCGVCPRIFLAFFDVSFSPLPFWWQDL